MSLAAITASTFGSLARARQHSVVMARAYDAASDACDCNGRDKSCACSEAWRAYQEAKNNEAAALASYMEIADCRRDERAA